MCVNPRRREGKRYNLPGLVGMLLLAAVNGEESLRGMWLWGCGACGARLRNHSTYGVHRGHRPTGRCGACWPGWMPRS